VLVGSNRVQRDPNAGFSGRASPSKLPLRHVAPPLVTGSLLTNRGSGMLLQTNLRRGNPGTNP